MNKKESYDEQKKRLLKQFEGQSFILDDDVNSAPKQKNKKHVFQYQPAGNIKYYREKE